MNKVPSIFHPKNLMTVTKKLGNRLFQNLALEEVDKVAKIIDKVIYNSVHPKLPFLKTKEIQYFMKKKEYLDPVRPSTIALKYFTEENSVEVCERSVPEQIEPDHFDLPYRKSITGLANIETSTQVLSGPAHVEEPSSNPRPGNRSSNQFEYNVISDGFTRSSKKWMNDYEKYVDEEDENSEDEDWKFDYGTADPSVPSSKVPCGGCGAILHCQDYSIPGFLPREVFSQCTEKDLQALKCQRCHFLENYNTALSVTVDANYYPTLLSRIKDEKALVILLVDLTDFPSSLWPGILDLVGQRRPIFLVGNKVDLLWGDSKGWMERVKSALRRGLSKSANVKHVSLISAKTGYGIEELITALHSIWEYRGDVYLIGCTNVGKSTLFNALLQSDYCKVKAVDLLQRATTAPWPGTTLNLLKFPILRPAGWRLFLRMDRLKMENEKSKAEQRLAAEQKKSSTFKKTSPTLLGHIGRTFKRNPRPVEIENQDSFSVPNRKQLRDLDSPGLDPNDPDYAESKWVYDTPGVLHKDQILDLLTTEEIVATLPKTVIEPRTYRIKPGWTTFIAGLARLDYIKGEEPVKLTVFSSSNLPITICETLDADAVYTSLLETDYFVIPVSNKQRLQEWPNLEKGSEFTVCGIDREESCCDVLLSSAGWIAITVDQKKICSFLPWTPHQRGIHIRCPPLLPFAVSLRGKKILKCPAYAKSRSCQLK